SRRSRSLQQEIMATSTAYSPWDTDTFTIWPGVATIASPTQLQIVSGAQVQNYYGSGFTYGLGGAVTGGTLTGTDYWVSGVKQYEVTGLSHSMATAYGYLAANDPGGLLAYLFSAADVFNGSSGNDVADGYAGNDLLYGNDG